EGGNIEGGIGWPVAGLKRHGPHQLAVRHDLEETADIRYVLAFRRAHHRAEDAAGAKVDLAIDRFPRRRREPFLDMLGHGPRRPYELRRDVDHALQNEIKPRIVLEVAVTSCPPSAAADTCRADRGGPPTARAVAPSSAPPPSAASARAGRCARGRPCASGRDRSVRERRDVA